MPPDLQHTLDTSRGLGKTGHLPPGRYTELPVDDTAGAFRCRWVRHVTGDSSALPIRVLPDNCADFIATDDGRAWLVGPATRAELSALPPGTVVRGLRIQPHALWSVIDAEPAELVDRRAGFDEVLSPRAARTLVDALLTDSLDHRLVHQLWPRLAIDDRVARGLRSLASQPNRPVDEIAHDCALSPRQFRRVVRQVSGLSPKTLQRVSRLHRVIAITRQHPETPLSMVAASAGYADQSHLARDARKLADLTPQQLVRAYR